MQTIEQLVRNKDSTAAQAELLRRLKPLVLSSIRKYYYRAYCFEDLVQMGNLMILESLQEFDERLEVPYLGYIKWKLKYLYLNLNRQREDLSLNTDEDGENSWLDSIPDPADIEEDLILKQNIQTLLAGLKQLSKSESRVVIAYYLNNHRLTSLSKEWQIPYRTLVNTKTRAIGKLREYFLKQG